MMNTFFRIALPAVLAAGIWACNNTPQPAAVVSGQELLGNNNQRGAKKINMANIARVDRLASDALMKINLKDLETFTVSSERNQADQDAAIVVSLFNNLMTAESTAAALKVNFMMSEEPVADGVFVFTLETEEKQTLSFEMYDEEGFTLAANNKINLVQGTNFKAINVSGLSSGNYIFKLKNNEGASLVRKVSIQTQG